MFIALVRVYIFIHLLVIVSDFKMPFNNINDPFRHYTKNAELF